MIITELKHKVTPRVLLFGKARSSYLSFNCFFGLSEKGAADMNDSNSDVFFTVLEYSSDFLIFAILMAVMILGVAAL